MFEDTLILRELCRGHLSFDRTLFLFDQQWGRHHRQPHDKVQLVLLKYDDLMWIEHHPTAYAGICK